MFCYMATRILFIWAKPGSNNFLGKEWWSLLKMMLLSENHDPGKRWWSKLLLFFTETFLLSEDIFSKNLLFFAIIFVYLVFNSIIFAQNLDSFTRAIGFLRFVIIVFALIYYFNLENSKYEKKIFKAWTLVFFLITLDLVFEFIFGFNILNFKSKEGADQVEETYKNSAPTEFAEAEQLLEVRIDDTTLMFVSLYPDNDAMERASAARSKRMDINKDIIESMDGKTGNVILNHNN